MRYSTNPISQEPLPCQEYVAAPKQSGTAFCESKTSCEELRKRRQGGFGGDKLGGCAVGQCHRFWHQALRSAWTKLKVNSVLKTLNLSRVQNLRGWGWPLTLLPSEPTHIPFNERPEAIPAFDWPLGCVPGGCCMRTHAWQPQIRRLRLWKMRGLAWVPHEWD